MCGLRLGHCPCRTMRLMRCSVSADGSWPAKSKSSTTSPCSCWCADEMDKTLMLDNPLDEGALMEAAWIMVQNSGYPATPELLMAHKQMVNDCVVAFLRALEASPE